MVKIDEGKKDASNNPVKILLIEDDRFLRELYEDILKEQGYIVISLPDARRIYEILEKEKIDLIISGIMQPFKDGLVVLEELKKDEKYKHIPYIVLSGIGGVKELRQRALKGGAALCLDKGKLTPTGIVEKIQEVIEKKS